MTDLSLLPPSAAADGDDLRIAGVSLRELAREFGTPVYVLDEDYLRARAREYVSSFTSRHPRSRICFAAKAFPSASVIQIFAEEGLGCDVVGAASCAWPWSPASIPPRSSCTATPSPTTTSGPPWTRASATSW